MIRLRGHLICQTSEEAAAVRWNLPQHIALSRASPGCLSFELAPTDDPLVFEVMESFRTREDFEAHQARTPGSRRRARSCATTGSRNCVISARRAIFARGWQRP